MKLLIQGLAISALLHASIYWGGLELIAWQKARHHTVAEIDLKSSTLLMRPARARGRTSPPAEPWLIPDESLPPTVAAAKPAPRPPKREAVLPEPEEATTDPGLSGPPATAPEPVPAAAASRIPVWIDGVITEEDYPPEAKAQGKEGKVVASVCIAANGQVNNVDIVEGADPDFNQLVMRRLKVARFQPGLDRDGNPVAVRMTIPIVFQLN